MGKEITNRKTIIIKYVKRVIIVLVIIFAAYLLYENINIRNELNNYKKPDLIYDVDWNNEDKCLVGKWKENNNTAFKYYDRNTNFKYEENEYYNLDGTLRSIFIDKNENGIYETINEINKDNKIIQTGFDKNEDGYFEEFVYNYKAGETKTLLSRNEDGFTNMQVVEYPNGVVIDFIDSDADVFNEVVIVKLNNKTKKYNLNYIMEEIQ